MMADKYIEIQLIKSKIGRMKNHKKCIDGLGFKKLNQVIDVLDTPSNRGLIRKVNDMIKVIEN